MAHEAYIVGQSFDQLLAHAAEECAEVAQALAKAARFGMDSVNPDLPPEQQETNADGIWREFQALVDAMIRPMIPFRHSLRG